MDGLRGRVHPKVHVSPFSVSAFLMMCIDGKAPTDPVMDLSILRLALHEGNASPERLNEVPKEASIAFV